MDDRWVIAARYCQAEGPASILPITYWYPCWWGISPWASPHWRAERREA